MLSSVDELIKQFSLLPNIGSKTATKIAYFLLKSEYNQCESLSKSIIDLKKNTQHCKHCYSIAESSVCAICDDASRDKSIICVVEEPFNVFPIEKTGEFNGVYHVLLGRLSPQSGIGPDQIKLKELMKRLDGVTEIIIATNPNVEGEATALYLSRIMKSKNINITRIAFGIPVGGDLEYIDEVTLGRSISSRNKY